MFSLGIKIFQTNIIKVLLKKCYGPALKAPSSDQSVRPSACPFEISCPEHIFSPLAQYGSYFTITVPLSKTYEVTLNHVSRSMVKVIAELYKNICPKYISCTLDPVWLILYSQNTYWPKMCSDLK